MPMAIKISLILVQIFKRSRIDAMNEVRGVIREFSHASMKAEKYYDSPSSNCRPGMLAEWLNS